MESDISKHRRFSLFAILILQCFRDRLWDLVLTFLVDEWLQYDKNTSSNRYVSIIYLVPRVVFILSMPHIVSFSKNIPKITLLQTLTVIQNVGIVLSALIFSKQMNIAKFKYKNGEQFDFSTFLIYSSILLLIQTIVNTANKISGKVVIQRDWTVHSMYKWSNGIQT